MAKELYYLLDSRVNNYLEQFADDPNFIIPDWTKYILYSDEDWRWVCDYANSEELGSLCVVANKDGRVLWEWFSNDWWYNKEESEEYSDSGTCDGAGI